ncbi:hypothetical protein EMCRGX_G025052 [Ephydatia muelleri]
MARGRRQCVLLVLSSSLCLSLLAVLHVLQKQNAHDMAAVKVPAAVRLLSYQPPGNGWNNQRIALENALVLAKLLNRTLVVHPLSPHELGAKLKAGHQSGYEAYNLLNESDLLPLKHFMDLQQMALLVPVIEVNTSHGRFRADYSRLTWRNVCHSSGFGYWVDQPPGMAAEVLLLSKQKFTPNVIWKQKCPEEQRRSERDPSPILRFVTEFAADQSEMLYFEQGTLFGIQIRFTALEMARTAQEWVLRYVQYNKEVWQRVGLVGKRLGTYNAVQMSKITHGFQPFKDAGFNIYFAEDFPDVLDFTYVPTSVRMDLLGVHEQCICQRAGKFVASPASTFDAFIRRQRGEVKMKDGLMMDTLHSCWIGHHI